MPFDVYPALPWPLAQASTPAPDPGWVCDIADRAPRELRRMLAGLASPDGRSAVDGIVIASPVAVGIHVDALQRLAPGGTLAEVCWCSSGLRGYLPPSRLEAESARRAAAARAQRWLDHGLHDLRQGHLQGHPQWLLTIGKCGAHTHALARTRG